MGYEIECATTAEHYDGASYVVIQSDDILFPEGTKLFPPKQCGIGPSGWLRAFPTFPRWERTLPGEKGRRDLGDYLEEEVERKVQALPIATYSGLDLLLIILPVFIGFLLIVIGFIWLLSDKSVDGVNKTATRGYTRPWYLPEPKPTPRRKSFSAPRPVALSKPSTSNRLENPAAYLSIDELLVDPRSLSDEELTHQRQQAMAAVESLFPDLSRMSDQQLEEAVADGDGMFDDFLGE